MNSIKQLTIRHMLIIIGGVLLVIFIVVAARLLMLKNDVAEYRNYWATRAAQEAPEGAIMYIALGDSVAQGIGASQPMRGYVGKIATELERSKGKPVKIVNLSVTGAKVADVRLKQLPLLAEQKIDTQTVITLDIGSNDLPNYDKTTFMTEVDELFKLLPKQTVVADIPYFGDGRARRHEPKAVQASHIIHEVAARYSLRVAPVYEVTKSNNSLWGFAADFFHPNDRGYQNWFVAFWQVISQ